MTMVPRRLVIHQNNTMCNLVPRVNQCLESLIQLDVKLEKNRVEDYGFSITGDSPVCIYKVTCGSSARAAGLRPHDFIVAINYMNVSRSTLQSVCKLIRNEKLSLRLRIARYNVAVSFHSSRSSSDVADEDEKYVNKPYQLSALCQSFAEGEYYRKIPSPRISSLSGVRRSSIASVEPCNFVNADDFSQCKLHGQADREPTDNAQIVHDRLHHNQLRHFSNNSYGDSSTHALISDGHSPKSVYANMSTAWKMIECRLDSDDQRSQMSSQVV